jgi:hypothetical protein
MRGNEAPGRNDPCPCGSGRKFKRCCQAEDAARATSAAPEAMRSPRHGAHGLPRDLRAAAAREPTWAADVVPVLAVIGNDTARTVLVLVTAGELIVHHDARQGIGGEPMDVARALEQAVMAAAAAMGAAPPTLVVRHESVAEALRPLLEPRDIAVAAGDTPELEAVARSGLEHLTGFDWWPPAYRTDRWGAWGLPPALIDHVFAAAARFHRLSPWRSIANLQAPRATMPSGREWTCCVLGAAGGEYGLALYSESDDLATSLLGDAVDAPFAGVRGRVLSLLFGDTTDAGRAATDDARRHGWEIAGPTAWPSLMTVNSPGGGASRADVEDLVALLRALPDFVQAHGPDLVREERTGEPVDPIEWIEGQDGIVVRYAGEALVHAAALEARAPEILPAELADELQLLFREVSNDLGGDADEAAFHDAIQARLEQTMVTRNQRPLPELGGLSPDQVKRLLASEWDDPEGAVWLREDLTLEQLGQCPVLANARTLLQVAIERGGLGATAKGNLKLDVVGALVDAWQTADSAFRIFRESATRITEQDVWPLHEVRVVCELAGLLRKRKHRFEITRRGRDLAVPTRAGALFALLFRTCFRKYNLAYGRATEWPELQYQLGFTLYQLPRVARPWRTAADLLPDVVLPHTLANPPVAGHAAWDTAAFTLASHALDPLVQFGLLERRSPGRYPSLREDQYRITPLAKLIPDFDL